MDRAKAEVLRYLGRRNQPVPPELDAMVSECMGLMKETAVFRHVRRAFDIRFEADGIFLEDTGVVLPGGDIRRHLTGCREVVLLAATLGVAADNLIRRWESVDLTRALILDACAVQLVEAYCDEIEQQACVEAAADGLASTFRFSAGYGDFPLEIQPELLAVLNAGRMIGLTCTDSRILLPRKSVTAVIGRGMDLKQASGGCRSCNMRETCNFRKD